MHQTGHRPHTRINSQVKQAVCLVVHVVAQHDGTRHARRCQLRLEPPDCFWRVDKAVIKRSVDVDDGSSHLRVHNARSHPTHGILRINLFFASKLTSSGAESYVLAAPCTCDANFCEARRLFTGEASGDRRARPPDALVASATASASTLHRKCSLQGWGTRRLNETVLCEQNM